MKYAFKYNVNPFERKRLKMTMQDRELFLPTFRDSYWFDEDYRTRRAFDAEAEREAELAAQRDMENDDLSHDRWVEKLLAGLDDEDDDMGESYNFSDDSYYATGEDNPSIDDYLESTRVTGGMSVSEAAAYYGGSPAVLGERRSSYVSNSAYAGNRNGSVKQPSYRERVNKDVLALVAANKEALEAFNADFPVA
jgi:hypothetical protein